MPTFEQFKELTDQLLPQCIPDKYQYAGLEPYPISKHMNNCPDMEGFSFMSENPTPGGQAFPVCYYSQLYQQFNNECNEMDQLAPWLKGKLTDSFSKVDSLAAASRIGEQVSSFDPSKVFISLVNTEANQKFLKDVPHREFMDLSITYRYFIEGPDDSVQGFTITNEFAALELGMDERQLYEAAIANTPKLLPFETRWVSEIIGEEHKEEIPNLDLLCLSTDHWLYGPSAMLYPDVLAAAAARFGGDVFILPSSTNELLLADARVADNNEWFADMVFEVNQNQECILPYERLSNGAYFFDAKTKTISPAVDAFRPLSYTVEDAVPPVPVPNAYSPQQTQHSPKL